MCGGFFLDRLIEELRTRRGQRRRIRFLQQRREDPQPDLRVIRRLHEVPQLRLFFLGLKHPNPHVGEIQKPGEIQAPKGEIQKSGEIQVPRGIQHLLAFCRGGGKAEFVIVATI